MASDERERRKRSNTAKAGVADETPFDPYYKWLGIPPKDQPPNHYRLLALDRFESDPDVIDAAANRQMAYLQQRATGKHAALSQKLLNEITAARLCLLNPQKKAEYDAELKAKLAPKAEDNEAIPPPASVPSTVPLSDHKETAPQQPTPNHRSRRIVLVSGGCLALALVLILLAFQYRQTQLKAVAKEDSVSRLDKQEATRKTMTPQRKRHLLSRQDRTPRNSFPGKNFNAPAQTAVFRVDHAGNVPVTSQ